MYTIVLFSIASGPPTDTRCGQFSIHKNLSDLRFEWPGIDTMRSHETIWSDSREVRFSRQLGNQADKSPQNSMKSNRREDGNAIPLCQLRSGHDRMCKAFRVEKVPNLSPGRDLSSL